MSVFSSQELNQPKRQRNCPPVSACANLNSARGSVLQTRTGSPNADVQHYTRRLTIIYNYFELRGAEVILLAEELGRVVGVLHDQRHVAVCVYRAVQVRSSHRRVAE